VCPWRLWDLQGLSAPGAAFYSPVCPWRPRDVPLVCPWTWCAPGACGISAGDSAPWGSLLPFTARFALVVPLVCCWCAMADSGTLRLRRRSYCAELRGALCRLQGAPLRPAQSSPVLRSTEAEAGGCTAVLDPAPPLSLSPSPFPLSLSPGDCLPLCSRAVLPRSNKPLLVPCPGLHRERGSGGVNGPRPRGAALAAAPEPVLGEGHVPKHRPATPR